MTRDKIEEYLDVADEVPAVRRQLRNVVEEIECNVPGERTQELMYDLVGIVLMMGERVQELEYRVCGGTVSNELQRKKDSMRRNDEKGWQRVGLLTLNEPKRSNS